MTLLLFLGVLPAGIMLLVLVLLFPPQAQDGLETEKKF